MSSFGSAQKGLATPGDRAGQAGSSEKTADSRSHSAQTKKELQRGGDLNVTKNLAGLGL